MPQKKTPTTTAKRPAAKTARSSVATPTALVQDPYEWIETQAKIGTSDDIEVPDRLIDQVIGQEQAVAVAQKAALQKRNLLLIGDPGTGKSMIAKAMKQMLPPMQLKDVLMFHNPADPNAPKVGVVEAGQGRTIVAKTRALARRKKTVRTILEWTALTLIAALSVVGFFTEGFQLTSIMVLGVMMIGGLFLFQLFRNTADNSKYTIPKILLEYDPQKENHTEYVDATGSHAGALLGDIRHDPFQSGGLETPTHERVEPGAIHKAHKGILFIDEINVLRLDSQQALLTAMQDGKYSIVGQSENSSGAMAKTSPVPCEFILVAAGNMDAVMTPEESLSGNTGMHPALRSRIRGYGYEVYVNSTMPDTHENRLKLCRFVAQEVRNDGRISRFDAHAIAEVILEGQRRSGQRGKLTLRLRELGGLVRTSGDVAQARGSDVVTAEDVREAKRLSRSLEQQIAEHELEERRSHESVHAGGELVGIVPGAGLVGTGEVGEPAGLVVPINAAVTPPLSRHGGHIAFGGGIEGSARSQTEIVQALLKKIGGTAITDRDVHVQSVIAQDGVDARASGAALLVSALSAVEGFPVRQDTVIIAALTVTGAAASVRGITQEIETAIDTGYGRVIVPRANENDIMLNPLYRSRVEIVFVDDLADILTDVVKASRSKAVVKQVRDAGLGVGKVTVKARR